MFIIFVYFTTLHTTYIINILHLQNLSRLQQQVYEFLNKRTFVGRSVGTVGQVTAVSYVPFSIRTFLVSDIILCHGKMRESTLSNGGTGILKAKIWLLSKMFFILLKLFWSSSGSQYFGLSSYISMRACPIVSQTFLYYFTVWHFEVQFFASTFNHFRLGN